MRERFSARDYRFIAACLVLFAVTTWFSARNFYRAFPEASIDFRVNRDQGRALAGKFLAAQGYQTAGYREAESFTYDDEAKTFLEREAGLEQANHLLGTRIRLWRWSYRWFRPQHKEEFQADITQAGEVAGFEHEIEEDAARPAATAQEARALAERLLRERFHREPAGLDFVESSEVTRPHRVDRVFTWKERAFNLKDATNRLEVTLLGNEVGGYREYVKIPDDWKRDYQRLRSKNQVAQIVDTAVVLALLLGMLVVIVMRVRHQDVRWRRAAIVGLAGMALAFCASLNEFPLREFSYPTTDSYESFVIRQVLQALLTALGAGGLLFVVAAGAEPLYRESLAARVSLGHLFRPRGLRTKRFFLGAILGITLTGTFIAYQTAFYIVAYRFGAWSPADVPYTDLLNTRFPWLFVLFGGFLPAVSEEFIFRMFAIPFLAKLVRSTAIAVVLAGFIWGFGHAGYPQQPFYIRGVEVGIGGVALGLIMLRWGILPTLVWHYSVDAMYSAMLLVRSHNLYYKLSAAASAGVIVGPVILALVAYWKRGGFEPETGLLNADEGTAAAPPAAEAEREPAAPAIAWHPLSWRVRLAALAILVAGLVALRIPAAHFGESPVYKLPAERARVAASGFLRGQGISADSFLQVTFPAAHWGGDDGLAGKYFLERRTVREASGLFEKYRPIQHWAARYFKSLDQEEFLVTIQPESGKVLGYHHTVPENRPGADIAPDAARQIASDFAAAQGWDVSAMELKESRSEKKKARRDYTLVWEARDGDPRNVDEARYRAEIEVDGERPAGLRSYWKIPEAFQRSRSEQNLLSIGALTLRIAALAGVVVWSIWLLIQNTRKGLVRWRQTILIASAASLLSLVGPLLSFHLLLEGYNTAIPLQTFQASMYVGLLMTVIMAFVLLGAAAALVTSCYPESLPALRASNRRTLAIDAGMALAAAIGLEMLVSQAAVIFMDRFHAQALFGIDSPGLVASVLPSAAALAGAVRTVLMDAALLVAIVVLLTRLRVRWLIVPLALLAPFATLSTGIRTFGEFALQYGVAALEVSAAALFCLLFARRNYLAYALVFWAMALRAPMVELLGNGNVALTVQGSIVVTAVAVAVAWAVAPAVKREPITAAEAA